MKKRLIFVFLAGLPVLSSCRGPMRITHEKEEVLKTIKAFDNSFVDKDRSLFLTAITAQPDIIAFGAAKGENHLSREALVNAYDREVGSVSILRLDRMPLTVRFSPDGQTAWAVCLVDGQVQLNDRIVTVSDMRSTIVLEKQNGRWAIVHVHTSLGFER